MHTSQEAYRDLASLPPDIELVWHGVNDEINLRQFLASDVSWAELDINTDPVSRDLILRHDSFDQLPRRDGEALLYLRDALPRLVDAHRRIKLDFKVGGKWIDAALAMVDRTALPQDRLWLNGDLDVLGEDGIRRLSARYPAAVVQVPLHSLGAKLDDPQGMAREVERTAALGVNRYSVGWRYPDVPGIVTRLKESGREVNIYGVADLQQFLQAVDMRPNSVTADFNFPEWGYYGRGSGHGGAYHAYTMTIPN